MNKESKYYPHVIDTILRIHDWECSYLEQMTIPDKPALSVFIEQVLEDFDVVFSKGIEKINLLQELNDKYLQYQDFSSSVLYKHICSHIDALKAKDDNDECRACSAGAISQDYLILSQVLHYLNGELQSINDTDR